MPYKRWPRRSKISTFGGRRPKRGAFLLLFLLLVVSLLLTISLLLRNQMTDYAVSAARDTAVSTINDVVKRAIAEEDYTYSDIVMLEKDNSGAVTAITANTATINSLAADILSNVISQLQSTIIVVRIPIGSLTGNSLLMGRGPTIPINVVMLTSSYAGYHSELSSAGINQTRHQIILELEVQVSLLLPWRTVNTTVYSEVLMAETIIVGDVPQSYFNVGN